MTTTTTTTPQQLDRIDAYWRAANYLSVGEMYLACNPLLKRTSSAGRRQARPLPRCHGQDMPEIRDWLWGAAVA